MPMKYASGMAMPSEINGLFIVDKQIFLQYTYARCFPDLGKIPGELGSKQSLCIGNVHCLMSICLPVNNPEDIFGVHMIAIKTQLIQHQQRKDKAAGNANGEPCNING